MREKRNMAVLVACSTLLSLALGFAATEYFLRTYSYFFATSVVASHWETLKRRPRSLRPKDSWLDVVPYTPADARVQSIVKSGSANGKELQPFWLVLGDSVAAGGGLNDHRKAFPQRLEELLASSRTHPARAVPVLNGAVGAIGPREEVLLYKRHFARLSPELLILQVCYNDFDESLVRYEIRDRKVYRVLMRHEMYDIPGLAFYGELGAISLTIRAAQELLTPTLLAIPGLRDKLSLKSVSIDHMRSAFAELNVLRRGRPVIVVYSPILRARSWDGSLLRDSATQKLAFEQGFAYLSLSDLIMRVGLAEARVQEKDSIHPNVAVHRLIAEAIAMRAHEFGLTPQ